MPRTTLLAIDDASLPYKKNLCYYLSKPHVRSEPVLTPTADNPNAPDSLASHFYGAVLYDEGKFRMWYYACSLKDINAIKSDAASHLSLENMNLGPVCYAESDDGIHWHKPKLGQFEFKGSRENNAVALSELPLEGVAVIKDEDDSDPQRRYKMVYNYLSAEHSFSLRTATSADGINWFVGRELPIQSFAEHSSFYKHNGYYIVNAQVQSPYTRSEGGGNRGRTGIAWISPDFDNWLQESAESFVLPEPANPEERGTAKPYRQVHLGVGASSFGNVLVGLYCVWNNQPKEGDWFGLGTTSGDLVLVVSNDGIAFREPVKGHVYLSRDDSPVTPVEGEYETVLCQANGILNVGDETRIYHGRWRNAQEPRHYYGEVALATLPRDRWGALGLFPDQTSGSVWSAPLIIPPSACVTLNADGVAGMRVEISDERFNLLSEYSGANAGTCDGKDGLDCPVRWRNGALSSLANTTVRLRIHLQTGEHPTPRLYAAYLQ